MAGYRRYRAQCETFIQFLFTGHRPDMFEEAYGSIPPKVCGFYECEARAIWEALRAEDEKRDIRYIAEVGRNLGGELYLLACALPKLECVLSVDIKAIPEIDHALHYWMEYNGIVAELRECDSREVVLEADERFDLVYIDGEHTGPGVRSDIEIFRGHTRLIAFHDFADRGSRNHHKRTFRDVVAEISKARDEYGWQQVGRRGRSEIVFRV